MMKNLNLDSNQKDLLLKESQKKISELLNILQLNEVVSQEHLEDTPKRIAKMFINELFKGCYENPPKIVTFSNEGANNEAPVMVSNITVKSTCAHHFVPFFGKASILYFPGEYLTGLSKFSRVVEYFSRRPQIQEILTNQIGQYLVDILKPKGLYVAMRCKHLCMIHRGVEETNSVTDTYYKFGEIPSEFIRVVNDTLPKEV